MTAVHRHMLLITASNRYSVTYFMAVIQFNMIYGVLTLGGLYRGQSFWTP